MRAAAPFHAHVYYSDDDRAAAEALRDRFLAAPTQVLFVGRMMDAGEAERSGLVAKVVPAADLLDEALKTAEAIAAMPPLAAIAVKEMVNAAFEIPLGQGIRFERRLFHGLFGTEDQKEGMTAFVEKRPGNWKGR